MYTEVDVSHSVLDKIEKKKRLTWDERRKATERKRKADKRRSAKEHYRVTVQEVAKAVRDNPVKFLEDRWPQYMMFSHDCLVPSLIYWTKFSLIYNQYKRYCEVIGEKPELTKLGFVKLLTQQYVRRSMGSASLYGAVIRKDVIIEDTTPVHEIYKSAEQREQMLNPPTPELEGANWAEGEEDDE